MRHLRIAIAAAIAASTSIVLFSAGTTTADNPNDASYWEDRTDPPSTCVKIDPPGSENSYGGLADDGKAVVLNEPDPGEFWALLVVKAGSTGGNGGEGNQWYENPEAGVEYVAPLNNGGQEPAVSHWIVCSGEAEPEQTEVSWTPSNGTCESPEGSLAVVFTEGEATYTGSAAGLHSNGQTVSGSFAAAAGYEIVGDPGPFSHTFELSDAPCDEVVTPGEVSFVDPTCAAPGAAVEGDDDTDALDYTVSGSVAPGESVTVTVVAKDGYVLADGATTEWSHTFEELDEGDCVVQANPDSSIESECAAATLKFSNDVGDLPDGYTAESATFSYTIDGETSEIVVGPNETKQVPVSFDEDSGVHTVQIGDGHAVEIETNCEPDEVTPNAVSFIDPTCAAPGVSVVGADDTEALDYTIDGSVAPGESVTVTVVAKDGYVLVDGATDVWTHDFSELGEDDCVVQANPQSSLQSECGSATLTFSNSVGDIPEGYTGASASFTYLVDGVPTDVVVEANAAARVVELEFDEDSGDDAVQIEGGQEVIVETNCELDEVTTVAPEFIDPTCAAPTAVLNLPTVEGVEYSSEGSASPGSTVTVTATALEGYVLDDVTEWTHDFTAIADLDCEVPPEPLIEVAAFSPVCRADVPFISYNIVVSGTDADTATLTFVAGDGDIAAEYEDVPLSGTVIYPGASQDPQDWPGWKLNDAGFWVTDDEDADWRNGLTVEVEVNPTATASVTYPDATEACTGPDVEPPTVVTIPVTTVAIGQAGPTPPAPTLPSTGSNATSGMVTIGTLLLLGGATIMLATRRRVAGIR